MTPTETAISETAITLANARTAVDLLKAADSHMQDTVEAMRLADVLVDDLQAHFKTLSPELVQGIQNELDRQMSLAAASNRKARILSAAAALIANPDATVSL